jgi:hypothetical protein
MVHKIFITGLKKIIVAGLMIKKDFGAGFSVCKKRHNEAVLSYHCAVYIINYY